MLGGHETEIRRYKRGFKAIVAVLVTITPLLFLFWGEIEKMVISTKFSYELIDGNFIVYHRRGPLDGSEKSFEFVSCIYNVSFFRDDTSDVDVIHPINLELSFTESAVRNYGIDLKPHMLDSWWCTRSVVENVRIEIIHNKRLILFDWPTDDKPSRVKQWNLFS